MTDTQHEHTSGGSYKRGANPDDEGPKFSRATVRGDQLVMYFTDAHALEEGTYGFYPPSASLFKVLVNGQGCSVTRITVNGAARTVTLTLATAVGAGVPVTVGYTSPTSGSGDTPLRDQLHNNALSFNGPVDSGIDTTPPVLASATVSGRQLVLTYRDDNALDAQNKPAADAFTVTVGNQTIGVSAVAVNATAKTVTLTLAAPVAAGVPVSVSYADPTPGNDVNAIQDAAGNDAASFTNQQVDSGVDVTAPVLASATVSGRQLVLTYSDDNALDAQHKPAAGAFTVTVGNQTIGVSAVAVNATAKTVTLTLAAPVAVGVPVSVSYADPTPGNDVNAIQDVAGNDAASFTNQQVDSSTDTTPPELVTTGSDAPRVYRELLVLTYTDDNNLSVYTPERTDFRVLVDDVFNVVTRVAVNAKAKTVTLTLDTAVEHGQRVIVSYTDPTPGNDLNAIQDSLGNDAASFTDEQVTNNTPEDTYPVLITAGAKEPYVRDNRLVLFYSAATRLDADHKASTGAFRVLVNGVENAVIRVDVNSWGKTVALILTRPVSDGAAVTVSYTDPTAGNDLDATQDINGNDAASFTNQPVDSGTDSTGPVLASATLDRDRLVLTYTEDNLLNADHTAPQTAFTVLVAGTRVAVEAVSVNAAAKTVTLLLAAPVARGTEVSVAYQAPPYSNASDNAAIQDAAGNDAASFPARVVVNNSPGDIAAPVLSGATLNRDRLVLSYDDASALDAEHKPAPGAFTVLVAGAQVAVSSVTIDATAKTVTLLLAQPVARCTEVSVAYQAPAANNASDNAAIQDAAGNDAASFPARVVTNNTPNTVDPTPPANPRGLDTDHDSVPNDVEDQAPRNGDGNTDGIADRLQAAVGSMNAVLSPQGESQPQGKPITSVTLVVGSQDGKVNPDSGARIVSMGQKDAPASLPPGLETPIGLVRFETKLATSGGHEKFSLYVDPALGVNGYWVQDSNGTWVNLASEAYGGKMVTEGDRLRLDFQIEDGGQFDQDGQVNASITTPGAPAHMQLSIVGQLTGAQHFGFWF